jgi:hypothetical protein
MKSASVYLRVVLSLMLLMLFVHMVQGPLSAQTTNGMIQGTVHDSSGAPISGVNVTLKSLETGATQSATTGGDGAYEFLSLPAGAYQAEASIAGFDTQLRKGIVLTVGATISVNFSLSVGKVTQTIVVTDDVGQVETASSTISGVVSETTIRELPLNGRDWLQLATLQAGVIGGLEQQSSAVSTNSRAARGNGENLYISGNRPTENLYMVDGLIVNDYANGSPGSGLNVNLGVDAVREFAVLTSDYGARDFQVGYEPDPRRCFRLLPEQRAGRAKFFRSSRRRSGLSSQSVRSVRRRTDRERQDIFLWQLRGTQSGSEHLREIADAFQRCAQRDSSQSEWSR